MRRRTSSLLLVATLMTGCGSTVPLSGSGSAPGQAGGDGLAAAPTAAPVPTGSGGTVVGGPSAQLPPAAAGGTSPGSHGTAGAASGPGGQTAPGAGSTRTTGPVSIGILYTINDAAVSAGVSNGNTFTPEAAYKALVKAWNDRGGLAGRRVNPVFVAIRSSSTSTATDLEAACQTFTKDNKVAAVLASTGFYLESFAKCLSAAGTPYLAADYAFGDDSDLASLPGLVSTSTLTTDGRMRALLQQLTAAKRLTRADRLGVIVESCPFDQRTYNRTVVPVSRHLGLTITAQVTTRCFSQIGDLGGQAADMQNAVLTFASRRVTQVLFVSGSVEGNLMLYFATAAESQAYHPHYALTSAVVAAVQAANTPKAQLANAVGLGWLPSLDRSAEGTRTDAQKRCLADLQSAAGVRPQGAVDRFTAYSACDVFALYAAALRGTRGRTAQADLLAALSALGSSFRPATTPAADLSGGRRTGPSQGRVFAWSGSCSCFDYTGPSLSLR